MMAVRSRQLSEAERIDTSRAEDAGDRQRAANALHAHYLAIASGATGWQAGEVSARRWYVLTVASQAERAVEKSLGDAGIEAWVPMKMTELLIQGTRKKRNVERPVWLGHIFVSVVPTAETWHGLRGVDGVRKVLGSAFGPVSVPDKKINELKEMVDNGTFNEKRAGKVMEVGQRVKVKLGSYVEFTGVVEGYVGTRAVRVMASMFGSVRPIEVDLDDLARIVTGV